MLFAAVVRRGLRLCAIVTLLAALPSLAADLPTEVAARALLGEAEKLIELSKPEGALPILDKVQAEYAGTEAAAFAELRRAFCFMYLGRLDEAIATARAIVAANPRTVLACWAQCVVGESLVKKKSIAEGVAELLQVSDMLPDRNDLGPLDKAMGVLGRVCTKSVGEKADPADALAVLGLSRSDVRDKARAFAIMAAYRAQQGRIDLANPILDRLATECPYEMAEFEWAQTAVAIAYLKKTDSKGEFGPDVADRLSRLAVSSGASDHVMARVHLALARYYEKNDDPASALLVLESSKDRFLRIHSAV